MYVNLILKIRKGLWRNDSAPGSRSEGWEFESLCPHFRMTSTVSGFVELLAMSSPLPLLGLLIHGALLRPLQEVDFMRLVCPPHWVSESHAQHMISFLYLHNTQTLCHGLQSRCQPFDQPHFGKYTWPGSSWRPSACEADVIATRPQVLVTRHWPARLTCASPGRSRVVGPCWL